MEKGRRGDSTEDEEGLLLIIFPSSRFRDQKE